MSVSLTVELKAPSEQEFLKSLNAPISPEAKEEAGASVRDLIIGHFESLPPNKQGWPTTNFYKRAARSTTFKVDANGVIVGIAQIGIRQRLFGGVIKAVRKKFLTIPANAEAYGHTAADFHNLRFMITAKGPALVEAQATRIAFGRKRKDGSRKVTPTQSDLGTKVMFWLKRSVNQQGNRGILPSDDQITQAAMGGLKRFYATGGSN